MAARKPIQNPPRPHANLSTPRGARKAHQRCQIKAACGSGNLLRGNPTTGAGDLGTSKQGDGAGDAAGARGYDHCRHHEGDPLAAAFGPRLPCRLVRKKLRLNLVSEKIDGNRFHRVAKFQRRVMISAQQDPSAPCADPAVEAELGRLPTNANRPLRVRVI